MTLAPTLLLLLLGLGSRLLQLLKSAPASAISSLLATLFDTVLFLLYPTVSTTLFDAFHCRSFCELGDPDKCAGSAGKIYNRLDSDLSIGSRLQLSNLTAAPIPHRLGAPWDS